MFLKDSQKGFTLLEVILVLAISVTFFLMGFRLYQQFSLDRNIQRINYDVDTLFQALKSYYPANCKNMTVSSPPNWAVNIQDLINDGYLTRWAPTVSTIIDRGTYILQFNSNRSTRNAYTCYKNLNTNVVTCSLPQENATPNTVMMWQMQVAVKLLDTANAEAYRGMLSADCLSTFGSGGMIEPCSTSTGGDYLVWERLPSGGVPTAKSSLWISVPLIRQFNQQYQNDNFSAFSVDNPNYQSGDYVAQDYLCGG